MTTKDKERINKRIEDVLKQENDPIRARDFARKYFPNVNPNLMAWLLLNNSNIEQISIKATTHFYIKKSISQRIKNYFKNGY